MNWGLSSLLHVMHMCREVNLASSSSWMYIAYNHFLIDLYYPSLISLFWQKGGEKFVWLILLWTLCWWLTKRGRSIWAICMISLLKGETYLSSLLVMHIWFGLLMYGDKIYDVIFTYMPYIAYIFMCFYCHIYYWMWCMS